MKLFFVCLFLSIGGFNLRASPVDSLTRELHNAPDDKKLDLLLKLSDFYEYSRPDSSLFYALQARNLAEQTNNRLRLADVLQRLGIAYRMKGDYDSAFQLQDEALAIWREAKDSSNMAGGLNNIGIIYDEKGINDKAISFYLKALRVYEELNEPGGMAKVYNNLGIINKKEGNYPKVLEYYGKALTIYEQSGNQMGMAIMNGNIGAVHLKLENYDKAINFSHIAIEKYQSNNLGQFVPYSLENIGLAYLEKGDLILAEENSKRALDMYLKYGNLKEASFSRGTLAEIYLKLDKLKQAEKYALMSRQGAQEIGVMDEQIRSLKTLCEIERKRKNFEKALAYFEAYSMFKDSVVNKEKVRTLEELQVKYETEKKEQELKVLKAESKLKSVQLKQGRNLIISIVVVSIVIFIGIILFHSRKRYKLKAELAEEKKQIQKTRFKAVIDAEEKERKRIARELHDGLGQLLSTARLTLASLDEEEEDRKVQNSVSLIDTAVQEVRSISHNMMPTALVSYGLEVALEDLVRKINQSDKINVKMEKSASIQLDESKSVAIYRVVQEIFNNVIKYAEATKIDFIISESGSDLSISIMDDGKGFDTSAIGESTGIGWNNILSRMDLIGGDVNIFSKLEAGTTVKLTIPNYERSHKSAAG